MNSRHVALAPSRNDGCTAMPSLRGSDPALTGRRGSGPSRALLLVSTMLAVWAPGRGMAEQQQGADTERLGSINFATSCMPAAQTQFNRAVALLHSFQFSRAIEGFNAVLSIDPACAMGYWGISLSNWSNPFAPGMKDKSQLERGRESAELGIRAGATTAREGAYLKAVGELYRDFETRPQQARFLAYRDAMADVATGYPDDHEAQIFYALALRASDDPADKTYAGRLKAGAILEQLFQREPAHPGLAHYLIHTYDVPALAGQALAAARRYSTIAPDAPHALHMPSHTFTRLGYWQESIDSNLAAAQSARQQGQTAEELHASDYEIYAFLQTAQDSAAARIVDATAQMASRFDPKAVISGAAGPSVGYFALAAIPARYALERQDWSAAEKLEPRETVFPYTDAITWFARGLGAARLRHAAAANEARAALIRIQGELSHSNEAYWARQVEIQQLAVAAWAAFAVDQKRTALGLMKSAAVLEDATEKSAVTPGPLAPARELLAEMLLQLQQPELAFEQFAATLRKEPRRFRSLYGAAHAARLSGKPDSSRRYFRELLEVCARADEPSRPDIEEAKRTAALPREPSHEP